MTNNTGSVRHGLYIPRELLAKIRETAQREKTSINKKIEKIIQEWFDYQKSKDIKSLSREEFHRLPSWRKREILAQQAEAARPYYQNDNDWAEFPNDEIHDY